jgi:hypothetical protein
MTDIDRVIRLISARCPEFTPSDRALVEAALNSDAMDAIGEVLERIEDAFAAVETRLARMDERLTATEARHETAWRYARPSDNHTASPGSPSG